MPAEHRIREIEEGILPDESYMIDNPIDALNYAVDFVSQIEKRLSNCTPMGHFKTLNQCKPLLNA